MYETDPLVSERVRQMVRGEGFAMCVVDDIELFHQVRANTSFDLFIVGVEGYLGIEGLGLTREVEPLVVLAPVAGRRNVTHLRVALPQATLVDRQLRHPDAFRQVLGQPEQPEAMVPLPDAVQRAFGPFGLSGRQLEVLSRALTGDTSREIAGKLFISELTVRNHLHAIYERVGVSGRRELLGRFVQGLIEGSA